MAWGSHFFTTQEIDVFDDSAVFSVQVYGFLNLGPYNILIPWLWAGSKIHTANPAPYTLTKKPTRIPPEASTEKKAGHGVKRPKQFNLKQLCRRKFWHFFLIFTSRAILQQENLNHTFRCIHPQGCYYCRVDKDQLGKQCRSSTTCAQCFLSMARNDVEGWQSEKQRNQEFDETPPPSLD